MSYYRGLVKALAGIMLLIVIGTIGYQIVEGWSLLDSFYMTVITLTTIGFAEVHPMTVAGRLFTVTIIFLGLGMVGYAVVTGTRFVVEGEINKFITRRRHMRAIHRIRDHFIVCGFGRMGSFICHELQERALPFVVVEQNPETQQRILELGYLMAPGDATEEETLITAGIESARGLVAVLDRDADNVYVVLTARELNSGLEIIARAAEESAHKKLLRAGASRVISPYQIGGMRMLMSILKPTVTSFLEVVMDHRQLNIELEEVQLGERSGYDGKKLAETDIRKSLNLIVIAVKKRDGTMVFNPGPDTVLNSHDTLIAMGQKEKLAEFRKEARVENQV